MNADMIFGQSVHVPIHRALQQLRWFTASFNRATAQSMTQTGADLAVCNSALTHAFLDWRYAFMTQKPQNTLERECYVSFSAGLMLRALVTHAPAKLISRLSDCDANDPACFWPEGHLYVTYCLSVRAAVLEEEFGCDTTQAPEFSDIGVWHSFRENMTDDPALAVPFLDLFAGDAPDWAARDIFRWARAANVVEISAHPR